MTASSASSPYNVAMRFLLVEDHADIAANIAEYFEARGVDVDCEADGQAGLQRATTDSYDAIVLDLMLPGLDGLTLCRQLRQAGPHARARC